MEITEDNSEKETSTMHTDNVVCNCAECSKKDRYVRIVDIDIFVDNLNDWD